MDKRTQKPFGFWTYEQCKETALKYDLFTDFRKENGTAYTTIRKNNWLELIDHLKKTQTKRKKLDVKSKNYWTYEKCKELALQHKTKKTLTEESVSCIGNIYKNGWLDLFDHMEGIDMKPKNYWSYERCKESIIKYKTYSEISKNDKNCLKNISRKGFDDLWSLIIYDKQKPNWYWSYEKCKELALNYEWLPDFSRENYSACAKIKRKGWLELIDHLKPRGYRDRLIYAYEFKETNSVYIGLTYSLKKRHLQHLSENKSAVNIHMKEFNTEPILKELTEYVDQDDAISLEEFYVNEYFKNGWIILNRTKTGSVGAMKVKWTKEYIYGLIKECDKRSEMREILTPTVLSLMRKKKWWDELTSHLIDDDPRKWDDELALKYVNSFDTKSILQDKMSGLHKYLIRRPNINLLFEEHWGKVKIEKEKQKKSLEPTKDIYLLPSSKYMSFLEFHKKDYYHYKFCKKYGWKDDIIFKSETNSKGEPVKPLKWTYESCKEEVSLYKTRTELYKNSKGCHNAIYKYKWLDLLPPKVTYEEIRKYDPNNKTSKGYTKYTDEMIVEICGKCKDRSDLQKRFSGLFKVLRKRNLLDHFFPKKEIIDYSKYTHEMLSHLCENYKNRSDLEKRCYGAHNFLKKSNLLNVYFPL